MFPNLTTIRGEKFREPVPYLRSLDLVLELDPVMIVPSHFEPIEDPEAIRAGVTLTRDALRQEDLEQQAHREHVGVHFVGSQVVGVVVAHVS